MDAITITKDQRDAHSHVVRPAEMEWQKTRFPGCEIKTLLFDRESGLVTALVRCAPGAVLPDHEHAELRRLIGKPLPPLLAPVAGLRSPVYGRLAREAAS